MQIMSENKVFRIGDTVYVATTDSVMPPLITRVSPEAKHLPKFIPLGTPGIVVDNVTLTTREALHKSNFLYYKVEFFINNNEGEGSFVMCVCNTDNIVHSMSDNIESNTHDLFKKGDEVVLVDQFATVDHYVPAYTVGVVLYDQPPTSDSVFVEFADVPDVLPSMAPTEQITDGAVTCDFGAFNAGEVTPVKAQNVTRRILVPAAMLRVRITAALSEQDKEQLKAAMVERITKSIEEDEVNDAIRLRSGAVKLNHTAVISSKINLHKIKFT